MKVKATSILTTSHLQEKSHFTSKSELAVEYNISRRTLTRYLKKLEQRLPSYDRKQRLLTPRQTQVLRVLLG